MVSLTCLSTMARFLAVLFLFPALSTSLPQPQGGGPPATPPTVQSLTMSGPGCPIGAGGLLQQIRNGTPVFVFTEWTLALPNTADANNKNQHSKWCTEQIQLANGPVGMQLRIATVGVGGWANLDTDTKLKVDVSTVLGGKVAGVSISPRPPNTFTNIGQEPNRNHHQVRSQGEQLHCRSPHAASRHLVCMRRRERHRACYYYPNETHSHRGYTCGWNIIRWHRGKFR